MLLFFHLPTLTKTVLIALIAILTLLGIMIRPFKWNEAMMALAGAGLLLVIGLINPLDAFGVLLGDWNIFLFFLGMLVKREIVQCAAEWHADLILICPRPPRYAQPTPGPKSVGHVARFVLDTLPVPSSYSAQLSTLQLDT